MGSCHQRGGGASRRRSNAADLVRKMLRRRKRRRGVLWLHRRYGERLCVHETVVAVVSSDGPVMQGHCSHEGRERAVQSPESSTLRRSCAEVALIDRKPVCEYRETSSSTCM